MKNYHFKGLSDGSIDKLNLNKSKSSISSLLEGVSTINPSVFGVCEIGGQHALNHLQSQLSSKGLIMPYTYLLNDTNYHKRNLAILSKYPIIGNNSRGDYNYLIEKSQGQKKIFFQRGVLDVVLKINHNYKLRYIGVHLKSKRNILLNDQELIRLNEAFILRKHLDLILEKSENENIILMGDFNDLKINQTIKIVQGKYRSKKFLSFLNISDSRGDTWTHYWKEAGVYSRYDYAFYSKGLKKEINKNKSYIHSWRNWNHASDHRPIVVQIRTTDK